MKRRTAESAAPTAAPAIPEMAYTPVTVPSRGLLYGPDAVIKTPRLPDGQVSIRKMLIAEEEILASAGGSALTKVNKILARCTKLPDGFDPGNLLLQDRMFLLISIRTHTFGPVYNIDFKCPQCGALNKKRPVNTVEALSEIPLREDVREPVTVDLPDAKVSIGIRLMRGVDEAALLKAAKDSDTRGIAATPLQDQLRMSIVEIDGEVPSSSMAKLDLIRRLTMADCLAIRSVADAIEFGVDTTINLQCVKCEAAVELDMPFGTDFLRPLTN